MTAAASTPAPPWPTTALGCRACASAPPCSTARLPLSPNPAPARVSPPAFPWPRCPMAKIRVLIADDHAVLRSGLRMLLNAQHDLEVVGEAASAREALDRALQTRPDILTLDMSMPGGSSVKVIEKLRRECPETRVVVLT